MVEVTFRAIKDGELYNKYFEVKAEKQKFHNYARDFFKKNDLLDSGSYYIQESLVMELTEEQLDRFTGQLKKYPDKNGLYGFKFNSKMQKDWVRDVVSKVDMNIINSNRLWWFKYIKRGSYSLWDYNGNVYGYLKDKCQETIPLTDDLEQIKLSEYYRAVEELESANKQ